MFVASRAVLVAGHTEQCEHYHQTEQDTPARLLIHAHLFYTGRRARCERLILGNHRELPPRSSPFDLSVDHVTRRGDDADPR